MEENNVFGVRLREKRKENKLTQKQLAEIVGAKHNSVSDWERGYAMPDPDTIVLICEALNVSSAYLLPSKNIDHGSFVPDTEIIYMSRSSGNQSTDELRKQLHDLIDQMDDEDLRLMSGLMVKFKRD